MQEKKRYVRGKHEEIQEEGWHSTLFFAKDVTPIEENNQQSKLQFKVTDSKRDVYRPQN